jgi:hypothetical protein
MHAYTVLLEPKLKEPIPTSFSTYELHALKNLELAHYVDHLQDENNELRKMMSWLSSHESHLRMTIEEYKRYDGQALGSDKIGECSGEGGEEIGDILAIFPRPTNDFQKPVKFVSPKESVVGEKKGEKSSEEKPSEQPQPKPKPKPIRFHCDYCGRDDHKGEFFFKRKREERMAKEWASKDRYNPSHGVSKSHMPLPRHKAIVRTVLAWGEKSALGGRDPAG